jgi:hypothetical protein
MDAGDVAPDTAPRETSPSETIPETVPDLEGDGPADVAAEIPADVPADGLDAAADTAEDVPATGVLIGPEGGTVDLPGGGTLVIPAGALSAVVEIVVAASDKPQTALFSPVGPFTSFAPKGLSFAKPALLTVPYDPAAAGADEPKVLVAWTLPDGSWAFLPSVVDGQQNRVTADVAHFSQGGPALPAAGPLVCCVLSLEPMGEAAVLTEAECLDAGGIEQGTVEQCDPVCCGGSVGGASHAALLPVILCDKGFTKLDAQMCEPVCCVGLGDEQGQGPGGVPGGMAAAKVPKNVCKQGGGLELQSSSCDTLVCCGVSGMGMSVSGKIPQSECEKIGQVLDPAMCDNVCCVTASQQAGLVASVKSAWACSQSAGMPVGTAGDCEDSVCCAVSGPISVFSHLPSAVCEQAGTVADPGECESTCCLTASGDGIAVTSLVLPKGTCEVVGGMSIAEAAECVDLVCCGASGLPLPMAMKVPKSVCNTAGSIQLEDGECDSVCCVSMSAQGGLSAVKASKALCDAAGATWSGSAADCSDLVCCSISGGPFALAGMVPKAFCDASGLPLESEACEEVCCSVAGESGAQLVVAPRHMCQSVGTEVGAAEDCGEEVCCGVSSNGMSVAALVPPDQCVGGTVLETAQCDQVCCVAASGNLAVAAAIMPKWSCQGLGGLYTYPASACSDTICCKVDTFLTPFSGEIPSGICADLGGALVDDSECGDVCCIRSDGDGAPVASTEKKWLCDTVGGTTLPPGTDCEATVCCGGNVGGVAAAILAPAAACAQAGGKVLDAGQCQDVCCVSAGSVGGGVVSVVPSWQCQQSGGASYTPVSVCESLVCCGVGAMGFPAALPVPEAECAGYGGEILEAWMCEAVCCKGAALGPDGAVVPWWTCNQLGGTPAGSLGECQPECCLSGGKSTKTTTSACKTAGGVAVPAGYCSSEAPPACNDDADCPAFVTACLKAQCGADKKCTLAYADGAPCADADLCTTNDVCKAGVCVSGGKVDCGGPAPGPCKSAPGICLKKTGKCLYPPANDGQKCDDGNPCTMADACHLGACTGQAYLCTNFSNPCLETLGTCNPLDGKCSFLGLYGNACDDGKSCTQGDQCEPNGECKGSVKPCTTPGPCEKLPGSCDLQADKCIYTPKAPGESCGQSVDPCKQKVCDFLGLCAEVPLQQAVCGDGCLMAPEACEKDGDCAAGQECLACKCQQAKCDYDADCAYLLPSLNGCQEAFCSGGQCLTGKKPAVECAENMDCGPEETCDLATCKCPVPTCGQGSWKDPTTGLVWELDTSANYSTYAGAVNHCAVMAQGGVAWHLPSIDELRTLVRGCPATEEGGACPAHNNCTNSELCYTEACDGCNWLAGPGLLGTYRDPCIQGGYSGDWSSTAAVDTPGSVWYLRHDNASVWIDSKTAFHFARCVHAP